MESLIGFCLFIFGCCVGSFINVLIDRMPQEEDIVRGRSHCDFCKRNLAWYELVPLVSWVIQGGISRCCHKKLSIQYPLIELITGIAFVFIYNYIFITQYQSSSIIIFLINLIASYILFISLLVIFITDLKEELIPLHMICIGFLGLVIRYIAAPLPFPMLIFSYIIPAGCAALFFFLIWFFSKGKAMGEGDISLVLLLGLIVGYPRTIIALYAAFLTGAMAGVILIVVRKKTMKSHVPFGPFLIGGTVCSLLFSVPILSWWSGIWVY